MKTYEKPLVIANEELAEGVYAASGAVVEQSGGVTSVATSQHGAGCNSEYMKGVYHLPDYNKENPTYGERLGCTGCPAFSDTYCQLLDYYKSGYTSYEVDNGHRKPTWEAAGHAYSEKIDWNAYDL